MTLRWVAVEMLTGRIIADLPDLTQTSPLKLSIGRYESATVNLPIPTAPDDWERATRPGYANLIALDVDGNGDDYPVWGGTVQTRQRVADGGPAVVELGLVTIEGYLDRRYVGDKTYTADDVVIAADLTASFAAGADGLPLLLDYTVSGTVRDRSYLDIDDATIYQRLTELMGVIGGPEWTMGWSWYPSGATRLLIPKLRVAARVGSAPLAGLLPNAQFEMPGSVIAAATVEDFTARAAANDVMAVGSSQGDTRPVSPHQVAAADGRPKFEFRWNPSTAIIETDTLTSHAQRALTVMKDGSSAVTLTAEVSTAPKLGVDWVIGDDIYYRVDHPSWPDGLSGVGRCIGWELTDTTVSPILAVPQLRNGDSS